MIIYFTADRAKAIQTVARVNQEATNKIIQELIAEKEKLLRELENEKGKGGYTDDDITRLREEQEREVSCVAPGVNIFRDDVTSLRLVFNRFENTEKK